MRNSAISLIAALAFLHLSACGSNSEATTPLDIDSRNNPSQEAPAKGYNEKLLSLLMQESRTSPSLEEAVGGNWNPNRWTVQPSEGELIELEDAYKTLFQFTTPDEMARLVFDTGLSNEHRNGVPRVLMAYLKKGYEMADFPLVQEFLNKSALHLRGEVDENRHRELAYMFSYALTEIRPLYERGSYIPLQVTEFTDSMEAFIHKAGLLDDDNSHIQFYAVGILSTCEMMIYSQRALEKSLEMRGE